MSPRLKVVVIAALAVAFLYVSAAVGLYLAMRQPPERFGAVMSHVPVVAMIALPFKPLWMSARRGELREGDPAPDFSLPTVDHKRTVRLSEEYRDRPVALIFGSYT